MSSEEIARLERAMTAGFDQMSRAMHAGFDTLADLQRETNARLELLPGPGPVDTSPSLPLSEEHQ